MAPKLVQSCVVPFSSRLSFFFSLQDFYLQPVPVDLKNSVYCDGCEKKTIFTHRNVLRKLPPLLCLGLRRFNMQVLAFAVDSPDLWHTWNLSYYGSLSV